MPMAFKSTFRTLQSVDPRLVLPLGRPPSPFATPNSLTLTAWKSPAVSSIPVRVIHVPWSAFSSQRQSNAGKHFHGQYLVTGDQPSYCGFHFIIVPLHYVFTRTIQSKKTNASSFNVPKAFFVTVESRLVSTSTHGFRYDSWISLRAISFHQHAT